MVYFFSCRVGHYGVPAEKLNTAEQRRVSIMASFIMTSHRNTFYITGPLWVESTDDRWISPTKDQ